MRWCRLSPAAYDGSPGIRILSAARLSAPRWWCCTRSRPSVSGWRWDPYSCSLSCIHCITNSNLLCAISKDVLPALSATIRSSACAFCSLSVNLRIASLSLFVILIPLLSLFAPLAYCPAALLDPYSQPAAGAYCLRVVGVYCACAAHLLLLHRKEGAHLDGPPAPLAIGKWVTLIPQSSDSATGL